jgi:hypothetical protein
LAPHNKDAASHLADAEKWIFQSIGNYFFPDGGMSEGADYWRFSWGSSVNFLGALAAQDPDAFFRRVPVGVRRSFDYPLYIQTNNSRTFGCIAYSDCSAYRPGIHSENIAFFAKYLRNPNAAWLLHELKDAPDSLSLGLFWDHGLEVAEPKLRLAKLFPHAGIVSLRSGFNYGDIHLNMQCGPWKGSHAHGDRAAFVIEAYGEDLAMEPGLVSYSDPRGDALGKTRLHNALTLDGQTQLTGGQANPPAKISTFVGGGRVDYFTADATGNYSDCKSYQRRVVYLRPDAFVISDHMQTGKKHMVQWNQNSVGVPELKANRLVLKAERARLLTVFATPQKLDMVHEEWPTNSKQTNHHVTLTSAAGKTTQQRYLAYLKPLRKGASEPSVETISGNKLAGFFVSDADARDIILENLSSGDVTFEDIRFDGRMAVVRTVGRHLIAACLAEGTKLSRGNVQLVDCTAPSTVSLDYAYKSGEKRALLASVQAKTGTRVAVSPPPGRSFAPEGTWQDGWDWKPLHIQIDHRGRAVISVPREGCPPEGLQVRLEFVEGAEEASPVPLSTTMEPAASKKIAGGAGR